MRTQTRIALMFFAMTVGIMVILGFAVYYFETEYTFADFYRRLETRAELASRIKFEHPSASTAAFQEMRDSILEKLPNEVDYFIQLQEHHDFEKESRSLGLPVSFFEEIVENGVADAQKNNIFFSGIKYQKGDNSFISIVSADNYYY